MSKKGQLAESGTWYFWSYAARACHPSNGRTLRYVGICIEHNAAQLQIVNTSFIYYLHSYALEAMSAASTVDPPPPPLPSRQPPNGGLFNMPWHHVGDTVRASFCTTLHVYSVTRRFARPSVGGGILQDGCGQFAEPRTELDGAFKSTQLRDDPRVLKGVPSEMLGRSAPN